MSNEIVSQQEISDQTVRMWDQLQLSAQKLLQGDFSELLALGEKSLMPAAQALGILVAFYFGARYASKAISSPIYRRVDETLGRFVEKLIYRGLLGAGLIFTLHHFGLRSTSFAAVLGAVGFAVGLAFQGTLSNFASGVLLMVFRPFKVGDMVVAGGITARVHEIDLFTTAVDTPDNRRLIIPNSSIAGSTIENVTYHPERRIEVPVGVAYSADMDATRAALWRAVESVHDVIIENEERKSQVQLTALGASSVDWIVRVWAPTKEFANVRDRVVYSVKKHLDSDGIVIAFPQLDVHLAPLSESTATPVPHATPAPQMGRQLPRRTEPPRHHAA
ncbi:Small-conductance mechanosensitive channel [Pirellula sp. SH-Sr6A]|uniref:mechanosensitive ion channel family protein n=1 Tax=Pirellula sp. SH-Sr6A TaxID=1632865 RepID=UPI00078B2251|nr:mechanosensitive ion channel domain-containing protein [Pirellula sp. SH-Sr6A]AMV33238.1 Small-conductance mechanosensitive channel [Pirellula sp. SH-Sr6A]